MCHHDINAIGWEIKICKKNRKKNKVRFQVGGSIWWPWTNSSFFTVFTKKLKHNPMLLRKFLDTINCEIIMSLKVSQQTIINTL